MPHGLLLKPKQWKPICCYLSVRHSLLTCVWYIAPLFPCAAAFAGLILKAALKSLKYNGMYLWCKGYTASNKKFEN